MKVDRESNPYGSKFDEKSLSMMKTKDSYILNTTDMSLSRHNLYKTMVRLGRSPSPMLRGKSEEVS